MSAANILLAANQPQGLGAIGKAVNAGATTLGLGGLGSNLQDQLDQQIQDRRKTILGDKDRFSAAQALFGTSR